MLSQSCARQLGGRLLFAWRQWDVPHNLSPSDCSFTLSSRSGRSHISNEPSGVVANCDHTLELVHWVRACIGIAMQWVMQRKSLLAFLLPVCKMLFSLYKLNTSFQLDRSMWRLTIHHLFLPSPVLQLVSISENTCAQPPMFPMLKTCKARGAGTFLICPNFETGPKLPMFCGNVVSARANQYATNASSSCKSFISK